MCVCVGVCACACLCAKPTDSAVVQQGDAVDGQPRHDVLGGERQVDDGPLLHVQLEAARQAVEVRGPARGGPGQRRQAQRTAPRTATRDSGASTTAASSAHVPRVTCECASEWRRGRECPAKRRQAAPSGRAPFRAASMLDETAAALCRSDVRPQCGARGGGVRGANSLSGCEGRPIRDHFARHFKSKFRINSCDFVSVRFIWRDFARFALISRDFRGVHAHAASGPCRGGRQSP